MPVDLSLYSSIKLLLAALIKLMSNANPLGDWLARLPLPRDPTSADLLSGATLNAVLTRIVPNYTVRISANATASARINNWAIVVSELEKLGIHVGQQQRSRILNGDEKTVLGVLAEVRRYHERQREEADMDLSRLDVRGDPRAARSLLELFILVIIKYYGFTVKEAVALLANDSKYLAHILAKGFKDKSKPVELMLADLIELLPQIALFCRVQENQVFFLKSVKPGLISKFQPIAEVTLQLLTAFVAALDDRYEVLKTELMPTLILCLRRHSSMLGTIVGAVLEMVGRNKNLLTLFLMHGSAVEAGALMLEMASRYEAEGKPGELFEQFRMPEFTQSCLEGLKSSQLFANSGAFLVKVVEHNYFSFAAEAESLSRLVFSLSHVNLSKRGDVIIHCHLLFALLQQFGRRKNAVAPQLLAVAVERYAGLINEDESQNYLLNFLEVMEYFPSIPAAPIVEAILTRYEGSTTTIRQLELDFFVGSLEGVTEKVAVRLLSNLTKVFIEETGFVEQVSGVVKGIVKRFDSKGVFELSVKLVKVCLSVHYGNLRKLSYSKSLVDGGVKIDKANVALKVKNLEIERLLAELLRLDNDKLSNAMEPLICYSFIQSELKSKEESEGLKRIMLMMGTEEELRRLYENDAKMMLEEKPEGPRKGKEKPKDKEEKPRVNSDASLLTKKRNLFTTLNPPAIAPDAQKGLEKYTKNFLEKVGKLTLEEERRAQQEERREELRRKVAVRMAEQGIDVGRAVAVSCLSEFNSRERQAGAVADYSYLPFYEQELEQERDVRGVQALFRRYGRLFRLYYSNYAKLRPNNIRLFDDLSQRGGLMQSANVWKLLRDHQLDQLITVNEAQFLVQRINAHFKKDYRDSSLLDYPAFENFLLQAALAMFTRPPRDLRSRPLPELLQLIVDRLKEHAAENRIDERLFEEEQVQSARPEELRELNEKLRENPDIILPEGYKKQTTKKVNFEYRLHLHAFDPAYAAVFEVLDQMLSDGLGIRLIEPYSVTTVQAYARPILYQTLSDSTMRERSLSSVFPRESRFRQQPPEEAGVLSRAENKLSKEKRLREEERALKEAEEVKRREERDREVKAMLEKHRERQAEIDRKKEEQRAEEARKVEEERKRKERYEEELKRKVSEYAEKKRQDREKEEEDLKRRKDEEAKAAERAKADLDLKRRMIEEVKVKRREEENARIQREAAEIKRREEDSRLKLLERKEKTIKMLEDYRQRKEREREHSQEKLKLSEPPPLPPAKPARTATPKRLKLTPSREKSKKASTPKRTPTGDKQSPIEESLPAESPVKSQPAQPAEGV